MMDSFPPITNFSFLPLHLKNSEWRFFNWLTVTNHVTCFIIYLWQLKNAAPLPPDMPPDYFAGAFPAIGKFKLLNVNCFVLYSGRCVELFGRSRMRQLRLDFNAVVASRRHRPLFVQRLRTLPQDEQRHQSTPTEASSPTGAFFFLHLTHDNVHDFHIYKCHAGKLHYTITLLFNKIAWAFSRT